MDYGDDDVPTRLLERWWGPVEQPGGLTIAALLRLPAIEAVSSLTLAVGPQVLVLRPTSGRTAARATQTLV